LILLSKLLGDLRTSANDRESHPCLLTRRDWRETRPSPIFVSMQIGLEHARRTLVEGTKRWSSGVSTFVRSHPGEGTFKFDRLTVGVVLAPLRTHHAAYGSDKRRSLPLLPGGGWIFPAGTDGWCRWDEPNDFLNVEIDGDLLSAAGVSPDELAPQAGEVDPLVAQLAVNIHAFERETPRLYRDALCVALVAQIAHMARGSSASQPTPRPAPRIGRALDYIEAHLESDIGLDELAAIAALSRYHFARAFREAVGMPPHAYLIARRVEKAKDLLRSGHLSVAEVAWQVGYSNPAKFSAQFRKLTGMAPTNWRSR
jgi:AraC family transcriptional regulator